MKKQNNQADQGIFRHILFSFMVVVAVTIALISFILYFGYQRILLYQIYTTESSRLKQSSYSAELLSQYTGIIMKQIYYDKNIEKSMILRYDDLNVNDLNGIYQQLTRYRTFTQIIHSIYLYNAQSNTIYSSIPHTGNQTWDIHQFFDKDALNILLNYKKYQPVSPIPRSITFVGGYQTNVYSFIFYDYSGISDRLLKAVMINVHESWMKNTINQLNFTDQYKTFILNQQGYTVLSSDDLPILTKVSAPYWRRTHNTGKDSGYFIDRVHGQKQLIVYTSYLPYGWTYVTVIPYLLITKKTAQVKFYTLLIALIILIFGLIFVSTQSKTLYQPIAQIISKLNFMENQRDQDLSWHRQDFLHNLLKGTDDFTHEQIKTLWDAYNVNLPPDSCYTVLVFCLDQYRNLCRNLTVSRVKSLKASIMASSMEICAQHLRLPGVSVSTANNQYVILFSHARDISPGRAEEAAAYIQQQTRDKYDVSLSCAISPPAGDLTRISACYLAANQGLDRRMFLGHGCLITPQATACLDYGQYRHSAEDEKEFIQALVTGNMDLALRIYGKVSAYAGNFSSHIYRLAMSHLSLALNAALELIERHGGLKIGCDLHEFLANLNDAETAGEIDRLFRQIIAQIATELHQERDERSDRLAGEVSTFIAEHYADACLSVTAIADHFHLSPSYLSRLFAAATARSITEHLTAVRMAKARELLLTTDRRIGEIVGLTGFTNSQYFNKVFKREFGVTPKEMRQHAGRCVTA